MCIASLYQSIIQNILESINFKKDDNTRFNVLVGDHFNKLFTYSNNVANYNNIQLMLSVFTQKLIS